MYLRNIYLKLLGNICLGIGHINSRINDIYETTYGQIIKTSSYNLRGPKESSQVNQICVRHYLQRTYEKKYAVVVNNNL